jgi:transposase-like protein
MKRDSGLSNVIRIPLQSPNCPACGSTNVTTSTQVEEFRYGKAGSQQVMLSAVVAVHACADCELSFTDDTAETAREEAVARHLGILSPGLK